jgi:hypothetical protein
LHLRNLRGIAFLNSSSGASTPQSLQSLDFSEYFSLSGLPGDVGTLVCLGWVCATLVKPFEQIYRHQLFFQPFQLPSSLPHCFKARGPGQTCPSRNWPPIPNPVPERRDRESAMRRSGRRPLLGTRLHASARPLHSVACARRNMEAASSDSGYEPSIRCES